jgi:hypothetical protein
MKTTRSFAALAVALALVCLCTRGFAAGVPPNQPPVRLPIGSQAVMQDFCVTNADFVTNSGFVSLSISFYDNREIWRTYGIENLPKSATNYQKFAEMVASYAMPLVSDLLRTNTSYSGNDVWYDVLVDQNTAQSFISLSIHTNLGSMSGINFARLTSVKPYRIQPAVRLDFTSLEVRVRDTVPPYIFGLTNGVTTTQPVGVYPAEKTVSGYMVLNSWYGDGSHDIRISVNVTPTIGDRYASFGDAIRPPSLKIVNSLDGPIVVVNGTIGTYTVVETKTDLNGAWAPFISFNVKTQNVVPVTTRDARRFYRAYSN